MIADADFADCVELQPEVEFCTKFVFSLICGELNNYDFCQVLGSFVYQLCV